jgi:transposase
MDERVKFIARLLDGEKMAGLCREFGVSRKTGYKILARYNEVGLEGLTDRSRRPYRHANQLPFQIETQIVRLKQDKPSWGAPKIRERLARLYPDVHKPAISTVHAVLDRHGLVKRRMGRRNKAKGTPLSLAGQPNDLWCADYKGEFMLADRRYCYPLTITDFASRYLFACEALSTTKEAYAFPVFEAVFKEFGLPKAIRTDNGVLRAQQAVSLVAQARHRDRAHQARLSAAERPPRTHASDLEARDHKARRRQLPPAAGQVRRLHRMLQYRETAPSAQHALSGRAIRALTPPLQRLARPRLPVPR